MPPLPAFVETYLPALLAQASGRISGEFHRTVLAHGLSVPEWRILASLYDAPPTPVGRLADLVVAPQSTVTRQLDRMQAKGLVQRVADAQDRRLIRAQITPKGRRTATRLVELAQAHEDAVLAPLGADNAARLKQLLRRLADSAMDTHAP